MATLALRLTIVPTSVSHGRSGGEGARTSTFGGGGGTTTVATAGGRREAENSGRSRVADSAFSGIVHNGLPARKRALGSGAGVDSTRPAAPLAPSVEGAAGPSTPGAGRPGSS